MIRAEHGTKIAGLDLRYRDLVRPNERLIVCKGRVTLLQRTTTVASSKYSLSTNVNFLVH